MRSPWLRRFSHALLLSCFLPCVSAHAWELSDLVDPFQADEFHGLIWPLNGSVMGARIERSHSDVIWQVAYNVVGQPVKLQEFSGSPPRDHIHYLWRWFENGSRLERTTVAPHVFCYSGEVRIHTFDPQGRLTSVVHETLASGVVEEETRISYEGTQALSSTSPSLAGHDSRASYKFDPEGRLIRAMGFTAPGDTWTEQLVQEFTTLDDGSLLHERQRLIRDPNDPLRALEAQVETSKYSLEGLLVQRVLETWESASLPRGWHSLRPPSAPDVIVAFKRTYEMDAWGNWLVMEEERSYDSPGDDTLKLESRRIVRDITYRPLPASAE